MRPSFEERRRQQIEQDELERGGKVQHAKREKPTQASKTRWQTLNQFVDLVLRDLSGGEVAVWLVLFRDARDGKARTGITDLATRCGMSRRGITKALALLKEKRLVEVIRRGSAAGAPNVYAVRGAPRN